MADSSAHVHQDDAFVDKIHKIVNGWAILTSHHQIKAVLAAIEIVHHGPATEPVEGIECMVCGDHVANGDIVCPPHAEMMDQEDGRA